VRPFDKFSNPARVRAIVIALIFSVILLVSIQILDRPLRTREAPHGIVSFELAKNYEQSRRILNSWDAKAKTHAALSLGLDYLFLIVYAIFIGLACLQVANGLQSHYRLLAKTGWVLAWAQILGAILDALENFVLIQLLLESSQTGLPGLARWCAIVKFSIVGTGLIYIFGGLPAIGLKKYFQRSQ
jgi:hypothetical protein